MSQAINQIRSEVKKVIKTCAGPDLSEQVVEMVWEKYRVCIALDEFTKIFKKTTGISSKEDRVMKTLHRAGALSRINAKAILKNYNKGYDLYGRPICTMTFGEIISDLHNNQRRLLALGARLARGQDKQMVFKTNGTGDWRIFNFVKGPKPDEYIVSAFAGAKYENWQFHLRLALAELERSGVIKYATYQNSQGSTVKIVKVEPEFKALDYEDHEELTEEQSLLQEDMGYSLLQEPVPVRSNEKHSAQIEYFTKQLEELSVTIQQYDDEIFRLSSLNNKVKIERQNFITILNLLKD
jgi:hypothetical protein